MKTRAPNEGDPRLRLSASVDGELAASDQNALEREMKRDVTLKRRYQRLAQTREAIQTHALREPAPRTVVKMVSAVGSGRGAISSFTPRWAMVAGVVVVAIVIAIFTFGSLTPGR